MNIALIGYGKMGKEVERVAKERGVKVSKIFELENNMGGLGLTKESLKHIDVCIDFSAPASVLDNIEAVVASGRNMVVGTTGWYDRIEHVRKLVKEAGVGLLYAPNFSLGINIFSQIVMDAARLLDKHAEYDVSISEVHHRAKADSPSGTALSLGSSILQTMHRKTELVSESLHGPIKPHQLHVTSTRVGSVTGRHTVLFDAESDAIELVHTAKGRAGFAIGAIVAAEWLKGKKGLYTMRDVILS